MRFLLLIMFSCILMGCNEGNKVEAKSAVQQCFEITEQKEDIRPILLNKCTGENWMLVRTVLIDNNKNKTGRFTYRWMPLTTIYGEPELSIN